MRILLNVAIFYAGWFASVIAAAHGLPWAPAAGLLVVALHLAFVHRPLPELKLAIAAGLAGLAAEALLMWTGVARYALPGPFAGLPPAWLVGLWMAFATTLNVSLGWLKPRLMLAAVLGLLVAPVSYYAGERLGGMTLAEPQLQSLAAVGLVWAAAFPLLVVLARRWDGAGSPATPG